MIIVGGRARSGARSHRSTPGAQVFRGACPARPAGREKVAPGPAARGIAAATGHGSIPGSARRLDMRS